MRITNKIMQNNALNNINNNKILQDKLNTQLTTQQKINRPSDDPVVALRALRLRSNLNQVTQYLEKNISDANSWLELTESALNVVSEVVTNMRSQCVTAAKSALQSTDCMKILENLKQMRDEVYATGNAECAGRTLFTGYRTNMDLLFRETVSKDYQITEQLTNASLDTITYIDTGALPSINVANYGSLSTTEYDVQSYQVNRLRLAYDNLDDFASLSQAQLNDLLKIDTGTVDSNGNKVYQKLDLGSGVNPTVTVKARDSSPNPYVDITQQPDAIYVIPETGEMLLGENVYLALKGLPRTQEFSVSYEKTSWNKGDLHPEHYFYCVAENDRGQVTQYNKEYLTASNSNDARQVIEYDIGFNQKLQVNTLADECFTHAVGRDVDEMIAATQAIIDMEKIKGELTTAIDAETDDTERAKMQGKLDAVEKSLTLLREKAQKLYESGITKMQGYLDQASLAITNVGSKSKRLELTENRLLSQQTNFKDLTMSNEGADVTEVAIQLSTAELSYEAALMATGKIAQNSLINFI